MSIHCQRRNWLIGRISSCPVPMRFFLQTLEKYLRIKSATIKPAVNYQPFFLSLRIEIPEKICCRTKISIRSSSYNRWVLPANTQYLRHLRIIQYQTLDVLSFSVLHPCWANPDNTVRSCSAICQFCYHWYCNSSGILAYYDFC